MKNETIIIGGGASGLMLASLLPKNSATLIESNLKLGAKMLISGGGKCNITNTQMGTGFFLGNNDFIAPVLKMFSQKSLLKWLGERKLQPVLRKESQYFCERSATQIVDILAKEAKRQKVLLGEKVLEVRHHEGIFHVRTDKRTHHAHQVVVASGGLSFPKLGASGIGYEIAASFGHTVEKTAAGLVGFTVQKEQFFFKELSGASTDVAITVGDEVCKDALLFTHKGLSGPAVLDASLYWEKGKITIDFLPDFSLKTVKKSKKQLSTLLPMPKRVTKAFLLQFGLDDKSGSACTTADLEQLEILKNYTFAPAGSFGYSKAEVTKGGVSTQEVDALTMMSQKREGLYFVGEVLDVTGRVGGYNFQWAFSSAYGCAKSLINRGE